ncbi:MAG: U32 family peptidase [Halobacteriovoraceae bacterium]|nr:U32 family peptidase [Halobacteriovoraceae bacterium]
MIKLVTYLYNTSQIDQFSESEVSEVIISNNLFSRFGEHTVEESIQLATLAKNSGLKTVFEWDKLSTEDEHEVLKEKFSKIDLSSFDSIRIQDLGALFYVASNFKKLKLQLVLETAHHNSYSFSTYFDLFPGQIERVILSIELESSDLAKIVKNIPVPCEILGLGRILLFYTPRSLISPLVFDHDDLKEIKYFEVEGNSQESPHKGFPIIENSRGTYMFNTSDFCLLEQIEELSQIGMKYFRFDNRFLSLSLENMISLLLKEFKLEKAKEIKSLYPNRVIRGFYHRNKSDVLFPKLKNQHTQRRDDQFLGEVFHVKKNEWLGIILHSDRPLELQSKIKIITPEGKEKHLTIFKLEDSMSRNAFNTQRGRFYKINYIKGVTTKSSVYFV